MAKNRFRRLMLLPILAPFIVVGWMLANHGKRKTSPEKKMQKTVKVAESYNYEFGMLDDLTAKHASQTKTLEIEKRMETAN